MPSDGSEPPGPSDAESAADQRVQERIRKNREAALKKLAARKRKKAIVDLTEDEDDNKSQRRRVAVSVAQPELDAAKPREHVEWTSEDVCESCGSGGAIDEDYRKAFKVQVCNRCVFGKAEYELVSKGAAQSEYLLPPSTLHTLRLLEKQNPRHSGFSSMKLYLRAHVREKALARWGSEEALEEERRRREREKFLRSRQKATRLFRKRA